MTKQQEFRKQTEEAKLEAFSLMCKKVADLEKENTELKETLKTYNGCGDWDNDFHACRVYLQHEELQMYIDQLTKAIELLKESQGYIENIDDILYDEIEQFLKETEK